jgi:hypothetical protein
LDPSVAGDGDGERKDEFVYKALNFEEMSEMVPMSSKRFSTSLTLTNTRGERITVPLTSWMTGLEKAV